MHDGSTTSTNGFWEPVVVLQWHTNKHTHVSRKRICGRHRQARMVFSPLAGADRNHQLHCECCSRAAPAFNPYRQARLWVCENLQTGQALVYSVAKTILTHQKEPASLSFRCLLWGGRRWKRQSFSLVGSRRRKHTGGAGLTRRRRMRDVTTRHPR